MPAVAFVTFFSSPVRHLCTLNSSSCEIHKDLRIQMQRHKLYIENSFSHDTVCDRRSSSWKNLSVFDHK